MGLKEDLERKKLPIQQKYRHTDLRSRTNLKQCKQQIKTNPSILLLKSLKPEKTENLKNNLMKGDKNYIREH